MKETIIIIVLILSVSTCTMYLVHREQIIHSDNTKLLQERTQLLKTCIEKGIDPNICTKDK